MIFSNAGPASTAASSAWVASSAVASATSQSASPVEGSSITNVPWLPSCQLPAMYNCLGTASMIALSRSTVIVAIASFLIGVGEDGGPHLHLGRELVLPAR